MLSTFLYKLSSNVQAQLDRLQDKHFDNGWDDIVLIIKCKMNDIIIKSFFLKWDHHLFKKIISNAVQKFQTDNLGCGLDNLTQSQFCQLIHHLTLTDSFSLELNKKLKEDFYYFIKAFTMNVCGQYKTKVMRVLYQ
jgi:hypothetical protein